MYQNSGVDAAAGDASDHFSLSGGCQMFRADEAVSQPMF